MKQFRNPWMFIVGAQRCGTTSLVQYLEKSSEIYWVTPLRPEQRILLGDDLQTVKKWESQAEPGKLICEKATSYIEYPSVAKKIKDNFANAKVVILLRDPVERAISNYYFTKKHGLEQRPLAEALFSKGNTQLPYATSVNPYIYIERGHYTQYVQSYVNVLGRERVYIAVLENLIASNESRADLIQFFGLKDIAADLVFGKANVAERSDDEIDSATISKLTDIYRSTNIKLAKEFSLDISRWKA